MISTWIDAAEEEDGLTQDFEKEQAMDDDNDEEENADLQDDLDEVEKLMEEDIKWVGLEAQPICHVLSKVSVGLSDPSPFSH